MSIELGANTNGNDWNIVCTKLHAAGVGGKKCLIAGKEFTTCDMASKTSTLVNAERIVSDFEHEQSECFYSTFVIDACTCNSKSLILGVTSGKQGQVSTLD